MVLLVVLLLLVVVVVVVVVVARVVITLSGLVVGGAEVGSLNWRRGEEEGET